MTEIAQVIAWTVVSSYGMVFLLHFVAYGIKAGINAMKNMAKW